jgi:superfamily I DNA/RNA helicase
VLPRPEREEESERKLVYVGLTRAQDMLYILDNTRSGYINELAEIARTETSLQLSD